MWVGPIAAGRSPVVQSQRSRYAGTPLMLALTSASRQSAPDGRYDADVQESDCVAAHAVSAGWRGRSLPRYKRYVARWRRWDRCRLDRHQKELLWCFAGSRTGPFQGGLAAM